MGRYLSITMLFLTITLLLGAGIVVVGNAETDPATTQKSVLSREVRGVEEKSDRIRIDVPEHYVMPQKEFVGQTFNNCGPAALSMAYSLLGVSVSQEELAGRLRPFNNPAGGVDDKSVFPDEFVEEASERGFMALSRPNGTPELVEKMVSQNIPVIVRTWLNNYEDIGHFRVVRGYDRVNKTFTVDDSYNGPNLVMTHAEFNSLWKPFSYEYIVIYPKEKADNVDVIVGDEMDVKVAWKNSLERNTRDVERNGEDYYAKFNRVRAEYHLGEYEDAIQTYEEVAGSLPSRMFWYQLEPILAYQKVRNYEKVFAMTDSILQSDNLAYSELYKIRGEVYKEQGNTEAANAEFENAIYYNKNYSGKL
jgi:hypothetical protein